MTELTYNNRRYRVRGGLVQYWTYRGWVRETDSEIIKAVKDRTQDDPPRGFKPLFM